MTVQQIFAQGECPGCTQPKNGNIAFCDSCYAKLPVALKQGLCKRFGAGFESAFEQALRWLRTEAKKARQEKLFE